MLRLLVIIFCIFVIILCKINLKNKIIDRYGNKERIILCLFGVIPRSIKYTWDSIQKNIVDVLSKEYIVDIYVFNLNIENTLVDDKILNQKDINLIPYDYFEEEYQKDIDLKIDNKCTLEDCKLKKFYSDITTRNAIRQMYSEYKVGLFLEKHNYDKTVIVGPDFYIYNKINMNDFNSIKAKKIYTSNIHDCYGYTNGFYFGKTKDMIKILSRYNNMNKFKKNNDNYELVVKNSFKYNNIKRKVTNILFYKIRADGHIKTLQKLKNNKKIYDNIKNILIKKYKIEKGIN